MPFFSGKLFPAHAGVIPETCYIQSIGGTFPRPRGGDPNYHLSTLAAVDFSPPTRG